MKLSVATRSVPAVIDTSPAEVITLLFVKVTLVPDSMVVSPVVTVRLLSMMAIAPVSDWKVGSALVTLIVLLPEISILPAFERRVSDASSTSTKLLPLTVIVPSLSSSRLPPTTVGLFSDSVLPVSINVVPATSKLALPSVTVTVLVLVISRSPLTVAFRLPVVTVKLLLSFRAKFMPVVTLISPPEIVRLLPVKLMPPTVERSVAAPPVTLTASLLRFSTMSPVFERTVNAALSTSIVLLPLTVTVPLVSNNRLPPTTVGLFSESKLLPSIKVMPATSKLTLPSVTATVLALMILRSRPTVATTLPLLAVTLLVFVMIKSVPVLTLKSPPVTCSTLLSLCTNPPA